MPASPADSALYRGLFADDEGARLFTDAAELRAMMIVEGALAQAQAAAGLIPAEAGAFLHRASLTLVLDPSAMAAATAVNGVPVPAMVAAFRKAAGAPEHAQYLHWGATSQDIMDTALALRLRQVLALWQARLAALAGGLAALAEAHSDLPMAARTYGQVATPTSFGAQVAGWGWPLLALAADLPRVEAGVAKVSLAGAAGTLSAMGPAGPAVRAALAQALGLADPGHGWHANRDGMAGLAGWCATLAGALGKMGEDLILATQSGQDEVVIAGAGASSTMPQKQNPVGPSVLVALARQVVALAGLMQGAGLHRQARDGAAWFTEWLTLPQLCLSTGRMLSLAGDLATRIAPDAAALARPLQAGGGVIHAEAFAFALAATMPRPAAQAAVTALCREAQATGMPLPALMARDHPGIDWQAMADRPDLGQAPAEARAFAAEARAVKG